MTTDNQQSDEAQFESGYGNTTTTEMPVVVEPKVEVKAQEPATEPEVVKVADPMAVVMERLEKFEKGHSTLAGRFGNLEQTIKQTITEQLGAAQAAAKTVSDAPTQAQVKDAAANPEEWETLKADFPEWASATEKLLESKLAANKAPELNLDVVDKRFKETLDPTVKALREEIVDLRMSRYHEDWQSVLVSNDFKDWQAKLPEAERNTLESSDNAKEVASFIDRFKKSKEAPAPVVVVPDPKVSARKRQIELAVNPRGAGGNAPTRSEMDEFEAGYAGR